MKPLWSEIKSAFDGTPLHQATINGTTYTISYSQEASGYSVCDGEGGAFGPYPTLSAAKDAAQADVSKI